jgi:hypothetical protein
MTRGKGGKVNPVTGMDRSLTVAEREDLQGMKQEAVATLQHLESTQVAGSAEMVDKGKLKQEIARYDAILHEGTPAKVSGASKDKLREEAKRLEDAMTTNMPTRDEMDHPATNPGAVRKHMLWSERNKGNVARYKEIMRTLEPDDPTVTSIDRLRRAK